MQFLSEFLVLTSFVKKRKKKKEKNVRIWPKGDSLPSSPQPYAQNEEEKNCKMIQNPNCWVKNLFVSGDFLSRDKKSKVVGFRS